MPWYRCVTGAVKMNGFLGVLCMDNKTERLTDEDIKSKSKSDKGILIFILLTPLPLFVLYLIMLFLGN